VSSCATRAPARRTRYTHTLRHSFASAVLSHSGNLRIVQQVLGHRRLSTVEIYTHPTRDELAAGLAVYGRGRGSTAALPAVMANVQTRVTAMKCVIAGSRNLSTGAWSTSGPPLRFQVSEVVSGTGAASIGPGRHGARPGRARAPLPGRLGRATESRPGCAETSRWSTTPARWRGHRRVGCYVVLNWKCKQHCPFPGLADRPSQKQRSHGPFSHFPGCQ